MSFHTFAQRFSTVALSATLFWSVGFENAGTVMWPDPTHNRKPLHGVIKDHSAVQKLKHRRAGQTKYDKVRNDDIVKIIIEEGLGPIFRTKEQCRYHRRNPDFAFSGQLSAQPDGTEEIARAVWNDLKTFCYSFPIPRKT